MAAARPPLLAARGRGAATLLTALAAAAVPLIPTALQAGEQPPPSQEELRLLQQRTLSCGRENTEEPCRQARVQADGLLDHPRLSGSCKDTLWTIREQAVVASGAGFERRDRLNRAGNDVLTFCRPQSQPIRPGQTSPKSGERKSGFGLIPNP